MAEHRRVGIWVIAGLVSLTGLLYGLDTGGFYCSLPK